jgi:hypothetical protein
MLVHIAVSNGFDNRSIAWALDHPGCFAYGPDGSTSVVNMGRAIPDYITWLEKHTSEPWFHPSEIDIRLGEIWEDYTVDADYNRAPGGKWVLAFFQSEWKPLTQEEAGHGLLLYRWARSDLMDIISGLSPSELDAPPIPGEEKTLRGILAHIAIINWWLLDRLNLTDLTRDRLPKDVFERLDLLSASTQQILPQLAGMEKVIGREGEFWSPRKLLRRLVWHERDHTGHILKILTGASA